MTTLKPMYGPDLKSLGLLSTYFVLKWMDTKLGLPPLGMISIKPLLEYAGALAAISTIIYNGIKTFKEIRNFVIDLKWRRKRRLEKESIEPQTPSRMSKFLDDLDTLYQRWKSETPALFKRIRNFGATLGTAGLGLVGPPAIAHVQWPAWMEQTGITMIVTGYVLGVVCQLACVDPPVKQQS
jgi:hypothetical protein